MMQRPNDLFKRIFSRKYHSVCVAVLGKNQSGKTDFLLHLMERLHDLGLMDAFGSNMPVEASFDIDFIEDFETLKKTCQMLNPNPNRKGINRYFYFGSEMGKWLPKDQAWRNVNFIEEMQLIRKYGLSFAGDAIDRVDERVLNPTHFQGCFVKYSKANPKVAYYDDWSTRERTFLRNIPRTTIKFDTFYPAKFFMEPQTQEDIMIPLNPEHKLVTRYLEAGSWAKAGIHPQEGKRALAKVLNFHMSHCLHSIQEPVEDKPVSVAVETD